jgi:L-amino acid N-acyltransferase YncA
MTTIRLATSADLEAIYTIWLDGIMHSFEGFEYPVDLREQFYHNFTGCFSPFAFWVAEAEGQVVGWQSLLPCTSNPLKRKLLAESSTYVTPKMQGGGTGELLLRSALQDAGRRGLQFVYGYVRHGNARLAKLVEQCGFVLTSNSLTPLVPPFASAKDLWIYTVCPAE